MLVCHCRRVNDRAITATVDAGARSIKDVATGCGAGSRCGGCWETIRALLDAMQDHTEPSRHDPLEHVA